MWDLKSRANSKISSDVDRTCEEEKEEADGFKKIIKRRQHLGSVHGSHHRDRLFINQMTLQRSSSDTILILLDDPNKKTVRPSFGVWAPLSAIRQLSPLSAARHRDGDSNSNKSNSNNNKSPKPRFNRAGTFTRSFSVMSSDAIEAKETVAIKLTKLPNNRTKLEFACEMELGFDVSHGAAKLFGESRLREIAEVSIYFQRLVPLKEYREADGVALGNDLLWTAASANKRVERLAEILK